jgi:hypothetical protein
MALKACKECGSQISTKAKICPRCGAPVKRGNHFGCLVAIIAVFVLCAAISNLIDYSTSTTSSSYTQPESANSNKPQQSKPEFIDLRKPLQSAVKKIPIKNSDGSVLTYENGIEGTNIRVGPGMNYAVDETGTLGENEILYVLEEKDDWVRFRVTREDSGWSAWIKKDITISSKGIEQAAKTKFGKPPYQNLDGSFTCVKEYLKSITRDPDSLVYEKWSDVKYNEGDGWLVMCVFRAKNGFGGYERDAKWFVIQHGSVVDVKSLDVYK